MPVFTDALIGDTTQLSIEEFGAYCMILFVTWRNNGQPLADDDGRLARICRVTRRRWEQKLRPVLEGFFEISDGFWRQKRLEETWQKVAELREINARRGAAGGRAKWLKKKEAPYAPSYAQAIALQNQNHITPKSPAEQGTSNSKFREEGTNPRATGDSPRQTGMNPRAHGKNARAVYADHIPGPPWEQRCYGWVTKGFWLPQWGPKPDEQGCLAPFDLVAEAVRRRRGDARPALRVVGEA